MFINPLIILSMKSKQKEQYVAPAIEVIKMQTEGSVMTGSLNGVPDGGSAFSSYNGGGRSRNSYNAASSSELEDLINDILTVEQ